MATVDLTGNIDDFNLVVLETPKAQPRLRHFRRGWFDPAKAERSELSAAVRASVDSRGGGPLFPAGVPVAVEIRCHMRRPNSYFKSSNRANALKTGLPVVRAIVPDIDNLAKFVLDAMNGLVCGDDRQVVKLVVLKLLDSDGACEGRTVVKVSMFDDSEGHLWTSW